MKRFVETVTEWALLLMSLLVACIGIVLTVVIAMVTVLALPTLLLAIAYWVYSMARV